MIERAALGVVAIAAIFGGGLWAGQAIEGRRAALDLVAAQEQARAREQSLARQVQSIAEGWQDEKADLMARALGADDALQRLRAAIGGDPGGADPRSPGGLDGRAGGAVIADCASRYRALAGRADQYRAQLLSLQEYVREVCLP